MHLQRVPMRSPSSLALIYLSSHQDKKCLDHNGVFCETTESGEACKILETSETESLKTGSKPEHRCLTAGLCD